jgi:DNA-nicking Smr family endonuclease
LRTRKRNKYHRQTSYRIDLHGFTLEAGKEALLLGVSKAVLADADFIEVVHGVGNGVMAKMTREVLESLSVVGSIRSSTKNVGVTLVYLKA